MILRRERAIRLIAEKKTRGLSPEERESWIRDCWMISISREEYSSLSDELWKEIDDEIEPTDFSSERYTPLIVMSIILEYCGVNNEYISTELSSLLEEQVIVEGLVENMYPCPCCGYLSLPEELDDRAYDICPVCFWEYDGIEEDEKYSSPNHMTLGEGKSNYQLLGVSKIHRLEKNIDIASETKYFHRDDNRKD